MKGKTKAKMLAHRRNRRIGGHRIGYLSFNPNYKPEPEPAIAQAWVDGSYFYTPEAVDVR